MQYPYVLLHKRMVLLLILTVTLFVILVKLGFWQLARGDEKSQLFEQMQAREAAPALTFSQALDKSQFEDLTAYRLRVKASPVSQQVWLLDNQVYQGQVGYLGYQVMQLDADQPYLIVELGFIAATHDRRQLPQIEPVNTEIELIGRLYQKQINPLSHKLMAESGDTVRFQNLNLTEMAATLGHPLLPAVLQPDSLPHLSLPHPWQPFPISAQKHWGYALQWFAMATVFAGLMGWQGVKLLTRNRREAKD
ncbi:SURF1 family protein [Shewanella sp. A25]|nr:SURF1 family protein [Shewanella shenzhenensis]